MSKVEAKFDERELEDIMREMEALNQESNHLQAIDSHEKLPREPSASTNTPSRLEHALKSRRAQEAFMPSSRESQSVKDKEPCTMDFNISGQMELRFRFNANGHEVVMTVRGDRGLEIVMGRGEKFTLPFSTLHEKKSVA